MALYDATTSVFNSFKNLYRKLNPGGVHLGNCGSGWESFPHDKPFFSCLVISCIPFQNVLSASEAEGTYEHGRRKKRIEIYMHIPELDGEPFVSLCKPFITLYHFTLQFMDISIQCRAHLHLWIAVQQPFLIPGPSNPVIACPLIKWSAKFENYSTCNIARRLPLKDQSV